MKTKCVLTEYKCSSPTTVKVLFQIVFLRNFIHVKNYENLTKELQNLSSEIIAREIKDGEIYNVDGSEVTIKKSVLAKINLFHSILIKIAASWAPVAHACNPSYSGGRDQEDPCSKPA
jgi:hypothetical protein